MVVSLLQRKNYQMPTKHYRYGGSTAHIWMNCLGAMELSRFLKQRTTPNDAMQRGSRIHGLAQHLLTGERDSDTIVGVDTDEEIEVATKYAESVRSKFGTNRIIEKEFNVNSLFGGTVDGCSVTNDDLYVWDLKTGDTVDPKDNWQLLFYMYLIYSRITYVANVHLAIWQDDAFKWWHPSREEIDSYMDRIDTRIEVLTNDNLSCTFGDHCGYCKAKAICGTYKSSMPVMLRPTTESAILSPEMIAGLIPAIPKVGALITSVQEEALALANAGALPGYQTVPGRARPLAWKDGVEVPHDCYKRTPMTATQASQILGDRINNYTYRPTPNTVLKKIDSVEPSYPMEW